MIVTNINVFKFFGQCKTVVNMVESVWNVFCYEIL